MRHKKQRQEELAAYLSKWGMSDFVFAVNPHSTYLREKDYRLYAFPGHVRGSYHELRSVATLVCAAKKATIVKLWTGIKDQYHNTREQNTYQEFESFDAFREYCMVIKLSGL